MTRKISKTRLLRIIREHAYAANFLAGAGDPAEVDAVRRAIRKDEKYLRDFVFLALGPFEARLAEARRKTRTK